MSNHYIGEVDVKLLRHGRGEYRYPNRCFRFDGDWKTGRKNGLGVFAVEGGSTFEGHFVDGEIEGKGAKTWSDGRRYEGNFSRGEACGKGRFVCPTGESYAGCWAENKRQGQGELVLAHGLGTYAGEFHRHRYHGDGRLLLSSGFQYSGKFSDGLPHGLGTATYPGGSTFKGPYERGRKSGCGGRYFCGVTGICFSGKWKDGRVVLPPSQWAVELDDRDVLQADAGKDVVGSGKAKAPAGAKVNKAAKGAKGKSKGAKQQPPEENADAGDLEKKPAVVAQFSDDGTVVGLWCRCAQDAECAAKAPEIPLAVREETEEEPIVRIKERPREVAAEETGRTLEVTLHEVTESSQETVGASTPFFIRRPDATDVSESLERYPTDELLALFQREKLYYPKGWDDELLVIDEAGSSGSRQQAVSETPIVGKGKPAAGKVKGKGPEKPSGDNDVEVAVETRWQTITNEVGSNRCLVIGAGHKMTLTAPRLFGVVNDAERGTSLCGEAIGTPENGVPEKEADRAPLVQADSDASPCRPTPTRIKREHAMIGPSSAFTVCLDFRLNLDLDALNNDDDMLESEGSKEGGSLQSGGTSAEKAVKIVACGERAEVYAVMRRWAPPAIPTETYDVSAAESTGGDESGEYSYTQTKDPSKGSTADQHSARPSLVDTADSASSMIWYVYAFTVRVGPTVAIAPCLRPVESQARNERELEPELGSDVAAQAGCGVCDLAAWHALGLSADDNGTDLPVLCIDGTVVPFLPPDVSAGASVDEGSVLVSDGVVIGGEGGEYATLAVKNLAVYNQALNTEQLGAITGVFGTWREEQVALTAADEREDEIWSEEARRATEEDREPEQRPEWLAGATSTTSMRRKTVHGEARINRIVLPKVATQGGKWVLRVRDVSHEEAASGVRSAAATEEERAAFPPLPEETIRLEQTC